jgi:hypothetical protein
MYINMRITIHICIFLYIYQLHVTGHYYYVSDMPDLQYAVTVHYSRLC